MKNINYFLLIISFVFLFNSCEENGIFFPASENGTFQVTFDGEIFSTENVSFTSDGDDIFINAIKPETNEIFTLKVVDFDIGSFGFEGGNVVGTYVKNDPVSADIWSTINDATSIGSIEFTKIDFINNTVSGNFNFVGKNLSDSSSKAFTTGIFTNIPISELPISADSFTAKVGGIVYEEVSLFTNLISIGSTELIQISANKSTSETIILTLQSNIAIGEYDFGSFITQTYPIGQYNINDVPYVADGKITITNHNTSTKFISGTFAFEAAPITGGTPNFSITEGEFSVSY